MVFHKSAFLMTVYVSYATFICIIGPYCSCYFVLAYSVIYWFYAPVLDTWW